MLYNSGNRCEKGREVNSWTHDRVLSCSVHPQAMLRFGINRGWKSVGNWLQHGHSSFACGICGVESVVTWQGGQLVTTRMLLHFSVPCMLLVTIVTASCCFDCEENAHCYHSVRKISFSRDAQQTWLYRYFAAFLVFVAITAFWF